MLSFDPNSDYSRKIPNNNPALKDILCNPNVPKDPSEAAKLALILCEHYHIEYDSQNPDSLRLQAIKEFLIRIVKNVDSLTIKVQENFDENQSNAFQSLCHLLAREFQGDSIEFQNISNSILHNAICSVINAKRSNLTSFSFSNCHFTEDQPERIAAAIENNIWIKNLTFNNCNLNESHHQMLSAALDKNWRLQMIVFTKQIKVTDTVTYTSTETLKRNSRF